MSQVLGFTIQIKGGRASIETATDVSLAIAEINKQLKDPALSGEQIDSLNKELIKLKGTRKELLAQQREEVKRFQAFEQVGIDPYRKLALQLSVARKEYKSLAAAGREFDDEAQNALKRAQELDKELKRIDANVGQFQRNVGNYPQTIGGAFLQVFPTLQNFSDGIEEIGQIAGRSGKALAASFFVIGIVQALSQGIQGLKDFSNEFQEARRQVNAATGAIGEDLDETVSKIKAAERAFGVDFQSTLDAVNAGVQKFGLDASRSIDLVNQSLVAVGDRARFLSNTEEELKKLVGIGVPPDSAFALLVEATNRNINVDVFTEPLIALREQTPAAVEALERAFGEERTRELFSTFQTEPIRAIREISSELSNLESTAPEVGAVLADVFKAAGEDDLSAVLNLSSVSDDLEVLIQQTGEYGEKQLELLEANAELAEAQNEVSKQFDDTTNSLSIYTAQLKAAGLRFVASILGFFEQLPATAKGVRAAIGAVGDNIVNFFKRTVIEGTIAFKQIEKLNPFGRTSEQIDQEIVQLRKRQDELANQGVSAGRAYREAFLEGLQEVEATKQASRVVNAVPIVGSGANGTSAERERELREQARQEARAAEDRNKLLAELGRRLIDERIAQIEDGRDREIAAQTESFNRQLAALRADRDRATLNLDQSSTEYQQILVASQQLEQSLTESHREQLSRINEQYDQQDEDNRLEAIRIRLTQVQEAFNIEQLKLEESLALGNLTRQQFDEKSFLARRTSLRQQIQELTQEVVDAQADGNDKEAEQLINQRQELNTELAKLEAQRTENVNIETQKRLQLYSQEFDQIAGLISDGVSVIGDFLEANNTREQLAFDQRIEAQESYIAQLESSISRATGTQKLELERQLENEKTKLEQTNQEKANAEREFAKEQKALSIIQTLISGAQGIVKTGANLGYPQAIPFQIAQGIQTAAQVALISAQPLATGGVVGVSGERVLVASNMPTLSNGDNVFATIKRGEVVLNERQQAMLGGPSTFRAIGVPGFADGGVLGAPISAPRSAGGLSPVNDLGSILGAFEARTEAINARIDRLQVFVVPEDIANDLADSNSIEAISTFG